MKHLIAFTALVASTVLPVAAQAQQRPCGDRDAIIARLSEKYGETRVSRGLSHNNGMVEIYASADSGTWTILITMPSGQTCLMAAGEFWEDAPTQLTRSGQPT